MNPEETVFLENINTKYQIKGNIIYIHIKGKSQVELSLRDFERVKTLHHQDIAKFAQAHWKPGKRGNFYAVAELIRKGLIPINEV